MIGKTIAHYKILEKLGQGGMGIVYKATDTHLRRLVAIKVLPAEAITNPERNTRFAQEAKAASALNHPNIVHVYDIDSVDGVMFIAMEYVEGKTLDRLIAKKQLNLTDTLNFAAQLADALAKAHRAGIVHRDVKPANIIITSDGLVKLVDFGVAKLAERIDEGDSTTTETIAPHTEEGAVVGTAAYMSPEQAQGKSLDARSDIFSFGAVLYEMVTGRRAFDAKTAVSILSSIVHDEPRPVREISAGVPPELEKIIARCLRKDAERRSQHLADVRLTLQELKQELDSGKSLGPDLPAGRRHLPIAGAIAAVLLALVSAAATWWLTREAKAPSSPTLTRLTSDSGLTAYPALSPDGKLLAYASDREGQGNLDIYVQQAGRGEPLRVTFHEGDDSEPSFSPDARRIAFRSERDGGGIHVVPTLGGEARPVAAGGPGFRRTETGSLTG